MVSEVTHRADTGDRSRLESLWEPSSCSWALNSSCIMLARVWPESEPTTEAEPYSGKLLSTITACSESNTPSHTKLPRNFQLSCKTLIFHLESYSPELLTGLFIALHSVINQDDNHFMKMRSIWSINDHQSFMVITLGLTEPHLKCKGSSAQTSGSP